MLSNFSVAPERRKLCNTPENINGLDPPPLTLLVFTHIV